MVNAAACLLAEFAWGISKANAAACLLAECMAAGPVASAFVAATVMATATMVALLLLFDFISQSFWLK